MADVSISHGALAHVLRALLRIESGSRGPARPIEASVEQLQQQTGLARGTVHNALTFLGPITERRAHRMSRSIGVRGGKPTILHSIKTRSAEAWVLQFDHDRLTIYSADVLGKLTNAGMTSLDVDTEPEQALKWGCARIKRMCEPDRLERIVGIGVAIPAPVDPSSQRATGGVLPAWEKVDVRQLIQENLTGQTHGEHRLKIIADNDANLAALAEHRYGAGRETKRCDLFFVKTVLGPIGIGGGAVIHGQPLQGRGLAMEFGHLKLDGPLPDGAVPVECPHCHSTTCLQARISAPALLGIDPGQAWDQAKPSWEELVASAQASVISPSSARLTTVDPDDAKLVAAQEARMAQLLDKDAAIRAIVFAAKEMGRALAQVVTLLDPDVIAIGGPLAKAWLETGPGTIANLIGDPLKDALNEHAPFAKVRTVDIRRTTTFDDTAQGAAATVLDKHLIDFLITRADSLGQTDERRRQADDTPDDRDVG